MILFRGASFLLRGGVCSQVGVSALGGSGPGGCLVLGGSGPGGVWSWGFVCSGGVSAQGMGVSAPRGVPGGDPPGRLLLRAVRILLECIFVSTDFLSENNFFSLLLLS